MKEVFAFRMSDDVRQQLRDKANELDRTESWVVTKALEDYLGAPPANPTEQPPERVKSAKSTLPPTEQRKPAKPSMSRAQMIQAYTRKG